MKKRILAGLMALVMAVTLLPAVALATDGTTYPVYVYFQTVNTNKQPVHVDGVHDNGRGNGLVWATLGKLSSVVIEAPTNHSYGTSFTDPDKITAVSEQVNANTDSNFEYYSNGEVTNSSVPLSLVDWTELKVCRGANDFTNENYANAWHLNGIVTGYRVIYKDTGGNELTSWVNNNNPNTTPTYYLGNATASVTTAVPTKEGQTFKGWTTNPTAENVQTVTSVSFATPVTNDDGTTTTTYNDVTLYAVWQSNVNNGNLTIKKVAAAGTPSTITSDKETRYNFTVTGPNNYSKTVTLAMNGTETLTSLAAGTYTVTETTTQVTVGGTTYTCTPAYNYSLNQTPGSDPNPDRIIEVDSDQEPNKFELGSDAVTVSVTNTYTATTSNDNNSTTYYYYAFRKVDAQDGKGLKGAKFGLYLDNSTEPLATASSYDQGIVTFQLTTGEYSKLNKADSAYFQEITPPDGYALSDEEYDISARDFSTGAIAQQNVTRKVLNYRTATPDLLNDSDHFAYVQGYKDGTVRPNGLISRAETTTIFFRLLKDTVRNQNLKTGNGYADVSDSYWANTAISTMSDLGIIQGYSNGTFNPTAPITRAQFAAICARFDTKQTSSEPTNLTDTAGHWAEGYIQRAVELGWIKGFEDGSFRPDAYITRAQAMTLINRVLNRIPEDEDDLLSGMTDWPDCKPGSWCYLAVQEATNSHNFKSKSGNYETWTSLKAAPDWSRYEN